MKISVIGAGYVGLVTGGCLAGLGHEVVCTDNDAEKLKTLESGRLPIYEPGLDVVIAQRAEGRAAEFLRQRGGNGAVWRCDFYLRGDAAIAQWQRGPERD